MINVCYQCGQYRADKIIDPNGPDAICPECGYHNPFLQLPLFVIAGASGSGKTTVLRSLLGQMRNYVLLDTDILWRPEFNHPENQYRDFFETWLRLCKNISQSGRPVMVFGAGFGVPENIEPRIERRYFSEIHYLALVCEDEGLRNRLLNRPDWRNSNAEEFIQKQQSFNHWFKENGEMQQPRIKLLDTTHSPVEKTASEIISWSRDMFQRSQKHVIKRK